MSHEDERSTEQSDAVPNGIRQRATFAPDPPRERFHDPKLGTYPAFDLVHDPDRAETYRVENAYEEVTIRPRERDPTDVTTWISAAPDAFVEASEMR